MFLKIRQGNQMSCRPNAVDALVIKSRSVKEIQKHDWRAAEPKSHVPACIR